MEEEEPTIEQVSALLKRTVVMDLNPYADFGIFVPYGAKALRASKFRTYTLTPEGYAVKELQGPATYIQWRSCFRVYTTALLMLNIADLAPLRAYELFRGEAGPSVSHVLAPHLYGGGLGQRFALPRE